MKTKIIKLVLLLGISINSYGLKETMSLDVALEIARKKKYKNQFKRDLL